MPTDYLDDLIGQAKQIPPEKEPAKKPEEKEEEIAREIKEKDLEIIEKQEEEPEPEEKTEIEKELEESKKVELTSYGKVKIFKVPGKPLNYYFVPTPKPSSAERRIINTLKEATTRLISIAPYKIRNPEERRIVYKQKILEIIKNNPGLKIPPARTTFYADAVVREMVGYGLIDDLIKDDSLEEIMIVGPKKPVYAFHREYEMMMTNIEFYSEQEIEDLINRIAREIGRRVDVSAPLLDARLPDGSRVNATIPPASISGGTITIRKFRQDPYSMIDLIRMGTLNSEAAAFLWMCVDGLGTKPANILISGGTGSGKTTLLNVLASFIPDRERVITIEDTAELNLPISHWIRMEARPPGLEGTGELKLDILTKNSLRMRPDRIIVGEIRHEEAFTLFTALNTGHDGAVTGDTLIQFQDGNIKEIQQICEENFANPVKENEYEFSELKKDIFVPSLNKKTLQIENKKVTHLWRKKYCGKMIKLKLRSGKEITLTKDHPVYKIYNGIAETNSEDIKAGDFIALPTKTNINAENSIESPYLLGLIYGDGHIGTENISITNTNNIVLNEFMNEASKITKNKVSIRNTRNVKVAEFFDKKVIRNFNINYKIPIGNKTKLFKFDGEILCGNEKDLCDLLKGLFDCESHVNLHSNSIQFATTNPDLAKKLPLIMQRLEIASSTNIQNQDGKRHPGPYYRISIYGKENLLQFKAKIGFKHDKKAKALEILIDKSANSIDEFPKIEKIIREARIENKLTQTELCALMGTTTRSVIAAYERNAKNVTRKQLKKIANCLTGETAKQLKIFAESNILFEKVTEAKETEYNGFIYDMTVEDNHNYLANGIIISNCLGTVHANSPEETIVRVTSPPMNVPSIMLSGLDLIIVEHRYYDRKKGTIRRVSEIAEIYNALEGQPKTQTIFQRDPAKDALERTLIESKYLKVLQTFTGVSKDRIQAELKTRKLFLDNLVNKNIRSLSEVSSKSKQYIEAKKGIGENK